jgi:hypothetical protein
MGDAKVWWFPKDGGEVAEINLGTLSSLQTSLAVDQVAAESMEGYIHTTQFGARVLVEWSVERFTANAAQRRLQALEGHLRRGGSIALAQDSAKAVAGYLLTSPARGATSVVVDRKPWSSLAPLAALAVGDEVVLEGPQPTLLREVAAIATSGAPTYTLTPGAIYDYQAEAEWVLMRHVGFFPVLRLPIDKRNQTLLTTDRRLNWTWRCIMEIPPHAYEAFSGITETVTGETLGNLSRSTDAILRDAFESTMIETSGGTGFTRIF